MTASIKPRIQEHAEWFANQMRICVDGIVNLCCVIHKEFTYRSPRTEICQFFARTRRELDAPDVLCSPPVCGKLINRVPHTNGTVRKQCARV